MGKAPETNLRQLLLLCHEHEDGKQFTPEQYAFLHGYVSALETMQGKNMIQFQNIRNSRIKIVENLTKFPRWVQGP